MTLGATRSDDRFALAERDAQRLHERIGAAAARARRAGRSVLASITVLFAGGFGDAAILHAGRTSGLAGEAEQTKLQMLFEAIGQLDAPVGGNAARDSLRALNEEGLAHVLRMETVMLQDNIFQKIIDKKIPAKIV